VLYKSFGGSEQRWARSRIRSGAGLESGYIFRIRIQIRMQIRYEWYGLYRMYVKAWQRWYRAGSGAGFGV